ncbi:uroporphyrinogen-III synthase [Paracoccus sp. P2]|uniref:Uroporphyrinogen-III synthase n=1 Tax=Paracoccus pantotrophus TaxID=82367 RepID=A0A1I5JH19_PARPN|nr:uroporphyrinogen-III synthase [Paracoccus pantotrophus]MDF3855397.1 uroporphyrinogen-III synthase [Paracoccus pantotrophus]QFG37814.1 uroporphyrinogen-III synthase [Paracoccus pantotrophus]QLH15361.1 uroporphyrinogen-III synthase [Paracoccus pantotrophus]RDD97009.1 uroporphyrinogen-III synthase [Paracoccus pantotrophus]RKS51720.1 uroporphyrinogen-III synthase [Paracoccus pantotrophus]
MPPNPAPILLLTRPEPASRRFAAEVAPLGLEVLISPVLRIRPVVHDAARLAAAQGLVFTSVNAVPAAGAGRGRPAICVGPATAEAAQAAGFDVTEGPGDAARMLPMLDGLGEGWLHPHGAHVAKVLPVPGMVVYDQLPEPLNAVALAALAGRAPVILPLFSPRSARLLSGQAAGARAPLWLAPISPAARDAWQGPAARCVPAPTPDAEGVLRAIQRLLAAEQST